MLEVANQRFYLAFLRNKDRIKAREIEQDRARERTEVTNPTVVISQTPTAILTDKIVNQSLNFLIASPTLGQKYNTDRLAAKVNRMKEKSLRCVSKKDFLSKYIKGNLAPIGLELELEPPI